MDDVFGYWFAGFFDGEGHLGVHADNAGPASRARGRSPTVRCIATIKLRADDEPILREIASTTGLGSVNRGKTATVDRRNYTAAHIQTTWWVTAKPDCARLVEIFDRYPLRSKKAADFAIWREAVLLMANPPKRTNSRGRLVRDWDALRVLAEALKDQRSYRAPTA